MNKSSYKMAVDVQPSSTPKPNPLIGLGGTYKSSHGPLASNMTEMAYLDYCYNYHTCSSSTPCCFNYNSYQENMCTYSYNCYSNSNYTFGYGPNAAQIASIISSTVFCIVFWSIICIVRRRRIYAARNAGVTVVT